MPNILGDGYECRNLGRSNHGWPLLDHTSLVCRKGTAAFAAGITLILLRWAFFGFLIELYGILVLFGDFFATIAGFVGNIPVVGPYVARALERLGAGQRGADLPV